MAYITNEQKALQFIKQHISLVKENNFDQLYEEARKEFHWSRNTILPEISEILIKSGINFLPHMSSIPEYALDFALGFYEIAKNRDLIIPNKFQKIDSEIRYRGEVILQFSYKTLPSNFIEGEIDILNLTHSTNLSKIELGAFRSLTVNKILVDKSIKNTLEVNKLDKKELLKKIELV